MGIDTVGSVVEAELCCIGADVLDCTTVAVVDFALRSCLSDRNVASDGIDVNVKNNHGNTALIIASRTGGTKIVEMLLEQTGINVNEKGKNGRTALMQAIMMDRPEIVKKLLKKGADITLEDNSGNTALTMVEDMFTKTNFPEIKTAIVEEHKKEIVGGRKSSKKTRKARKTRKDHRKKKIKTNKRK